MNEGFVAFLLFTIDEVAYETDEGFEEVQVFIFAAVPWVGTLEAQIELQSIYSMNELIARRFID